MKLSGTSRINEHGHLEIGGCDTVQLAQTYGTPLYIIDEQALRSQCQAYKNAFARNYPNGEVIYAGKALLTTAVCRIVEQEGLSLDVVSGGELFTALQAGFPPEKIYFHGNNKSIVELEQGIRCGVHRFVVDSMYELELLHDVATQHGVKANIYLRITPNVDASTHSYIKTGQRDSKFGFDTVSDQALEAVQRALQLENIRLRGLHCHIGSQIFDVQSFRRAVAAMFEFSHRVVQATGYECEELDVGGGMGIRYTEEDQPVHPEAYVQLLSGAVRYEAKQYGMEEPRLLIEPGRSIVGEAGTTLYTVGAIKDVPGVRTYAAVDGGMYENPRVALYQAQYEAIAANKMNEPREHVVSIAGKCCETGDMLIWDVSMPSLQSGDLIAVFSTGAYNYSMASNYNRLPRPAKVLVRDGVAELIVRRETYADLISHDVIPQRLQKETIEQKEAD